MDLNVLLSMAIGWLVVDAFTDCLCVGLAFAVICIVKRLVSGGGIYG